MKKLPTKAPKSSVNTKLSFKKTVALLVVIGLAMFGASGYYWYQNVLTDPQRIISDMLDKSLQTTSVTRTVGQASGENSIKQTIHTSFTPQVATKTITNLKENSESGETEVVTETIGTQTTDFIRYNSIAVKSDTPRDFSSVINSWGERKSNPETGEQPTFLSDALFMAVPFGNLNTEQRKQVKDEIVSVNLYDAKDPKMSFKNGRPVMDYTIELDPQSLVQVIATYLKVTGVSDASALDPASYEGATKIQIKLSIDVLSRHVDGIEFLGSGRVENYSAYGLVKKIDIPNQTIGIDELQAKLQAVEPQQQ